MTTIQSTNSLKWFVRVRQYLLERTKIMRMGNSKGVFRPEPMVTPDSPVTPPRSRADLSGQRDKKDSYFPTSGPQASGEGNVFPAMMDGKGYGGIDSNKRK